jgi:hypothetical protein
MSSSTLFRLSGLAAMLCGLCILSQRLVFDFILPNSLIRVGTFGPQLGLLGLVGLYLWQKDRMGRLGSIGFIVNAIGLAYLGAVDFARHNVLDQLDPAVVKVLLAGPVRLIFLTIGATFVTGVILFSIASLRAAVFPRPAILLYMFGFVPFALAPLFPVIVINLAQVSASFGVAWLGWALWSGSQQKLQSMRTRSQPA